MEIIKQIKAAESQAKEIIEKAKADAIKIAEDFSKERQEQIAQAAEKRRIAISTAVAGAEAAGKDEVEKLVVQGTEQRSAMESKAQAKVDESASKVVESICQGQGTSD